MKCRIEKENYFLFVNLLTIKFKWNYTKHFTIFLLLNHFKNNSTSIRGEWQQNNQQGKFIFMPSHMNSSNKLIADPPTILTQRDLSGNFRWLTFISFPFPLRHQTIEHKTKTPYQNITIEYLMSGRDTKLFPLPRQQVHAVLEA